MRRYGDFTAVDDVSFTVDPGELFGFLGPNGAGKTTTISILCTLRRPSGGGARVAGYDVPTQRDRLPAHIGLVDRKDQLVGQFSGGMKRRLEIARGLLHSPRVLFLDEPTIGLDPQTRISIWAYINELKQREDITIFLTTHYMDEAENCDRIAIIDQGRIVALDTPEALKASIGKDRVQIRTPDDEAAIAAMRERFGIEASVHEGEVTF